MVSEFPEFEKWQDMKEFIQKQIDGNFSAESDAKTALHLLLQIVHGIGFNIEEVHKRIDNRFGI